MAKWNLKAFGIITALIFSLLTTSNAAAQKIRYVLTASEYKRLSPEKQKIWMEALKNFMIQLRKIESRHSIKYSLQEQKPVEWFANLNIQNLFPRMCLAAEFLSSEVSHAQNRDPRIQLELDAVMMDQDQLEILKLQSEIEVARLKNLWVEYRGNYEFKKSHVIKAQLEKIDYKPSFYDEKIKVYKQRNPSYKSKSEVNQLVLKKLEFEKKFVELKRWGQAGSWEGVELQKNLSKAQSDLDIALAKTTSKGAPGYADVQKLLKMGVSLKSNYLQCTYAGWFQSLHDPLKRGATTHCVHPVSKVFYGEKEKALFSCDPELDEKKASSESLRIYRGNSKDGKIALCNPLLFGTSADYKPYCVKPGIDADLDCGRSSEADPKRIAAESIARIHNEEYTAFTQRVSDTCNMNPAEFYSKNLASNASAKQSAKDLSANCEELRGKLGDVEGRSQDSRSSGGTK